MNVTAEVIGVVGSILVLVAMLFKTTSIKGSLVMRSLNLVGSAIFIVYGALLPAYTTLVLNIIMVLVCVYHIIMLVKMSRKDRKENIKEEK